MAKRSISYNFIINLLFLFAINLVIKPIWVFAIDRNVQLSIGNDDYGVYYALLNISFLFAVILDLGLTNYNTKEVAQKNEKFASLFANIFSFKWILAISYIILCTAVAVIWRYNQERIFWLLGLAVSQVLSSFIIFFRSTLSALKHYFLDSILSVVDKVLMIVIIGYQLFINKKISIESFIAGQFMAYLVTFIIALLLVLFYKRSAVENPRFKEIRMIIRGAFPFTILMLWMTIYFRLDSILIERLTIINAKQESGIYASAFRLLDILAMMGYLFAMLLSPMFNQLIGEKKSIHSLIKIASPLLFSFAILVCCSVVFYRVQWYQIIYHSHNEYAANIMAIVLCSLLGIAFQYVYGTAISASGNLKLQNIGAFIAVIFNAGLNIYFIPHYGAMGAAIISFLTLTSVGIYYFFVAKYTFNIPTNYKTLSLWFIWILSVAGLFYYQLPINFFIHQILVCVVAIILGWLLNLIPIVSFYKTIKVAK